MVGLLTLCLALDRPFLMGFTPWPSEMSLAGLQQSQRFLEANGDLVSQMFIGGVPWPEALAGKGYSPDVEEKLRFRPAKGQKLFLSVSPLNMDRSGMAPYWGTRDNMPLPADWAKREFDDPLALKAYANWVLYAVERMKPDYLAIGVESNALLSKNRAAWPRYVRLHEATYRAVKARHPRLPVFFTTEVNHYWERATEAKGTGQVAEVARLMRTSDLFAMSYYPHMTYETIWPTPKDLFAFARGFRKPIAVSETGMISRSVMVGKIPLDGSEEKQRDYYDELLRSAQRDRYEFVVTFCTTDYERLIAALPADLRDLANIWTFSGLQTSAGRLKPAGVRWRTDFLRPHQR